MRWRKTDFVWITEEMGDGPREEYAAGAARVMAPILVTPGHWGQRVGAARDLLGTNTVVSTQIGVKTRYYVSRTTPFPYPDLDNSYATNLVRGMGYGKAFPGPNLGVDYDHGYRFDVTFQPRDYFLRQDDQVQAGPNSIGGSPASPLYDSILAKGYPDEGDALRRGWASTSRYVTRRIVSAGRLITIPTGFLQYGSGGMVPQNFPIPEAIATVSYTHHAVPLLVNTQTGGWSGVPWNFIQLAMNAMNVQQFDIFPPRTLLLTSVDHDTQPGPLGDMLVDIRFNMLFAPKTNRDGIPQGHCAALKATQDFAGNNYIDYDIVTAINNTSKLPLREVDFASLFRPDQPA